ncbi:MAG TPA: hypothetical protein VD789_12560 [Thermomicrobiales bacterium]|nr:hypothetical protein [Thermomicrobiales bacterium]
MADNSGKNGRRLLTWGRLAGLVIAAVALAFLALFAADNFVLIEIRLVNARIEMRLAWALLVAAVGGGIIGFVAGRYLR